MTSDIDALLPQVREQFPVIRHTTYMDLGGRAPLASPVRQAVDRYLDDCVHGRVDKDALFAQTEAVRRQFATLIHCLPDEVTFTKNTSEGLNMICAAMDWRSGDNVIICPELEHPNNIYLWLNLQRLGVEVRCIPHENGHMPVDAMIRAIDGRTRLLTASSLSFCPGFRTDVARLGRACRDRGALFLVDAAQSAGVLHTDVHAMHIDALSVSTQKGLLGLYGMGFLYVRKEVADTMRPAYIARFSIDLGRENALEYDYGGQGFQLMPGARRFDLGNYNFAGICAAQAGLDILLSLGTEHIERHVTELGHALANGFLALGLPVCGGAPGPHTAQTITLGTYDPQADGGNETLNRLYQHLLDNEVKLSVRRGLLRFSVHVYNNMDDVNRVLDLTEALLRGPKAATA